MDDDKIIALGGTEEDIIAYAEANGASDTTSKDDELLQFIKSKSEYWFMIEVKTGHWVVDEDAMMRDLVPYVKQYGIQERIDELELEKKAHLFQKKYTAPNSGAGRQIAADLQRVEKRITELTALKDKEIE